MNKVAQRLKGWGAILAVVLIVAGGGSDPAEARGRGVVIWIVDTMIAGRSSPAAFRQTLERRVWALSEDRRSELVIALLEEKGPRDLSRALGWVSAFDRNRTIDEWRRRTTEETGTRRGWAIGVDAMMSGEEGMEVRLDRERQLECVWRAAGALPDARARIFHLAALGWRPAELAKEFGVTVNTIKTQIQRAKHVILEQCRQRSIREFFSRDEPTLQ